jgi:RNA polymerase sigma factor (sigma-70 family)
MVYGVCQRVLRDAHDAEEAFQATFLALARRAGWLTRGASVSAWLYKVAYHAALNAKARRARTRQKDTNADDLAALPGKETATLEVEWREVRDIIDAAVQDLPTKYRVPFILCHLQGRSNADAARELGCPIGTLESWLCRARKRLRCQLSRRGITLSVPLLAATLTPRAVAAGVSRGLVVTTARSVLAATAAPGAGSALSPQVAALSKGALKSMFLPKWKVAAVVVIGLTLTGSSWSLLAGSAGARRLAVPDEASTEMPDQVVSPVANEPGDARDAARNSKLSQRVHLRFANTPLRAALDDMRSWGGVNIVVDEPALQERGITLDRPITIQLERVSFSSALHLLLRQVGLDATITDDVILVSTRGVLAATWQTKLYPIGDLLLLGKQWDQRNLPKVGAKEAAKLIKIIHMIEPDTWSVKGGKGGIEYWPARMCLAIHQTAANHNRIKELLATLRKLQDEEEQGHSES